MESRPIGLGDILIAVTSRVQILAGASFTFAEIFSHQTTYAIVFFIGPDWRRTAYNSIEAVRALVLYYNTHDSETAALVNA